MDTVGVLLLLLLFGWLLRFANAVTKSNGWFFLVVTLPENIGKRRENCKCCVCVGGGGADDCNHYIELFFIYFTSMHRPDIL